MLCMTDVPDKMKCLMSDSTEYTVYLFLPGTFLLACLVSGVRYIQSLLLRKCHIGLLRDLPYDQGIVSMSPDDVTAKHDWTDLTAEPQFQGNGTITAVSGNLCWFNVSPCMLAFNKGFCCPIPTHNSSMIKILISFTVTKIKKTKSVL